MSALRFAFRGAAATRLALAPATRVQTRFALPPRASFASAAGLPRETIEKRVLDVLKGFERVDPAKVCLTPSYYACDSAAYA
jgi:NADH dehydrogenase (ubiquinone) 1 alpha/beta subcomplex 1